MDQEPEVIKREIEQTSSSLKDKVEQLEEQVLGTVKEATTTVGNTVEGVKETVEDVKESVAETIQTVKQTFTETVHSIGSTLRRAFDLRYQTRRHPWAMVGGSVLAGFTAGKLLGSRGSGRVEHTNGRSFRSSSTSAASSAAAADIARGTAAASSQPGLFSRLFGRFEPEINKVKETAVGTLFGTLRDLVKRSLPPSWASTVEEVMNSVTTKLGGEPVHGPVGNSSSETPTPSR